MRRFPAGRRVRGGKLRRMYGPHSQAQPMSKIDIEHLRTWIDRREAVDDVVTAAPLRALAATLDRDDAPRGNGDPVPPSTPGLY